MRIAFSKYQGTGNDFVMIDDRDKLFPAQNVSFVSQMCNRKFGVGADGLILVQKAANFDFMMVYFNADGHESTMCGNGGRACVLFAKELGIIERAATFLAIDGTHEAQILADERVSLEMQNVSAIEITDSEYILDTGSPHLVRFEKEIDKIDVPAQGRLIRNSERFLKDGINVNFVQGLSTNHLKMRTYERGVEDETLSCGTGVVAAALSFACQNNLEPGDHHLHVSSAGGELEVKFQLENHQNSFHFSKIRLIGPAMKTFEGILNCQHRFHQDNEI